MERNKVKFWMDVLIFIDFLVLAISGFILKYIYPAGEKSGKAGILFLVDRFGWLKIHDITAFGFVIIILIHLFLNWNWIKTMFKSFFKSTGDEIKNGE